MPILDNATVTQLMNAFQSAKERGDTVVDNTTAWPGNTLHITCSKSADYQLILKTFYTKALQLIPIVMTQGHNIWGDSIKEKDVTAYHIVCSLVHLLRSDPGLQQCVASDTKDAVFRSALSAYNKFTYGSNRIVTAKSASEWRKAHGGQP